MATKKQREAARRNIRKAQAAKKTISDGQRARAQPEGRKRKKLGTGGKGDYYHVEVRPKDDFVTFRTQDVGDPRHIQRVAGQRQNGSWDTVKWLIGKEDAHVMGGKLIPDTEDARQLPADLGSEPVTSRAMCSRARRTGPTDKGMPRRFLAAGAGLPQTIRGGNV